MDVTDFGPELHQLVEDMAETMYVARGVGLAAPQIGVSQRVFVIDLGGDGDAPLVFVNPVVKRIGEVIRREEGCLSIPGVHKLVKRVDRVHVQAKDQYGAVFEMVVGGLMAICIQHENDHLDGRLMIDRH